MKKKHNYIKVAFIIILVIMVISEILTVLNNKNKIIVKEMDQYNFSSSEIIFIKDSVLIQPVFSKKNNLNCIRIYLDPVKNRYYNKMQEEISLEIILFDSNKNKLEAHKYDRVFFDEKDC